MPETAQKLCDFPEIKYVATSTGDYVIMTEIWTKDGRELTKLISEKIRNYRRNRKNLSSNNFRETEGIIELGERCE